MLENINLEVRKMDKVCFFIVFCLINVISVSAQPAEPVEGVPIRVYSCVLNSRATTIEPGTRFEMFINYENCSREPIAAGEVMLNCPEGVSLITNEGSQLVENVAPHGTVGKNYVITVSRMCDKYILPFEVWISNSDERLVKCYTIQLRMGQSANTTMKVNKDVSVDDDSRVKNDKAKSPDNPAKETIEETVPAIVETKGEARYIVTASSLNVRAASSPSSTIIGSVKRGDTVTVISSHGDWAEMNYKRGKGFVSSKYIRKVETISIPKMSSEVIAPPVLEEKNINQETSQSTVRQNQVYRKKRNENKESFWKKAAYEVKISAILGGGVTFPVGDFAKGNANYKRGTLECGLFSNTVNGSAGVGFNVNGMRALMFFNEHIALLTEISFFYNSLNRDTRDYFSEMRNDAKDYYDEVKLKLPKYINFPFIIGAHLRIGDFFVESGLGVNMSAIDVTYYSLSMKNKNDYSSYGQSIGYKGTNTTTFTYKVGVGMYFTESISLNFEYYSLGKLHIKGNAWSNIEGVGRQSTELTYDDIHQQLLALRLCFYFSSRKH